MQLDDLIEEHSIDSIAKKTNLAEAVVTKLFGREFKTLSLPQALGALSIIEREYDVDLDILRQECKAYFIDYDSLESGTLDLTPIKKERRIIPRLLVFILLAILAYGAWYFFTGYYNKKILPSDTQSEKSLNNMILDDNDTASKDAEKDTMTESVFQSDTSEDISRNNDAADRTDEPATEQDTVAPEANQSTPSAAPETAIDEQNDTIIAVKTGETLEENDSAEQAPVVIVREIMTLLPQEVMWFRLIDLNTKKRREFKRQDRYEIDLREHDWLFATENAHFAIIDNDLFEEYSGEGKLFFRLDQKGIHQLSEDEYRALEK